MHVWVRGTKHVTACVCVLFIVLIQPLAAIHNVFVLCIISLITDYRVPAISTQVYPLLNGTVYIADTE